MTESIPADTALTSALTIASFPNIMIEEQSTRTNGTKDRVTEFTFERCASLYKVPDEPNWQPKIETECGSLVYCSALNLGHKTPAWVIPGTHRVLSFRRLRDLHL